MAAGWCASHFTGQLAGWVKGVPTIVPVEAECGIIGCAAQAFVRYAAEITPDPAWSDIYARLQPVSDRLYRHSQQLYDDLDALTE